MLTSGVDAHKGAPVAVALDETGQGLEQWRGPNSTQGWADLAAWVQARGPQRRWGSEGAWNYGRGVAQYLVAAGAGV